MRNTLAVGILSGALAFTSSAQRLAQDSAHDDWQRVLIPSDETVYDVFNNVVWLADANLPAKIEPDGTNFRFGLPLCPPLTEEPTESCVNASGSMNYTSAVAWIEGMNDANYLGHSDWQLPTAPLKDPDCSGKGPVPYREGFAFGCDEGALGFKAPNTAVPVPPTQWGHSQISSRISIGPIRTLAAMPAKIPLPISVFPAGPAAAVAEATTRMFCR